VVLNEGQKGGGLKRARPVSDVDYPTGDRDRECNVLGQTDRREKTRAVAAKEISSERKKIFERERSGTSSLS